jgi:hypothetical protein
VSEVWSTKLRVQWFYRFTLGEGYTWVIFERGSLGHVAKSFIHVRTEMSGHLK